MKKLFLLVSIIISFMFLASCEVFENGCHIHNYQKIETEDGMIKAPTCTTYGVYKMVCSCGKYIDRVFDGSTLLDHDLVTIDEKIDVENNNIIIAHQHCQICNQDFDDNGNVLTNTIIDNNHIFSEYHEEIPATCDNDGVCGYYFCYHCNQYFNENYEIIDDLLLPATNHNYTTYIQNKDGTHQCICSNDKSHVEEELCSFGEWVVIREATQNSTGIRRRTCYECSYVATEEIAKLHEHEFSSEWTIDIEAKCGVQGLKSHHCLVEGCNEIQDETIIPALEHTYSDWKEPLTIDCSTTTYRTRTCLVCGDVDKEITYPSKHSYLVSTTTSTCQVQGCTIYTCEKCGFEYKTNYQDLVPHTFVNVEDIKYLVHEGSCDKLETYYQSCSVCQQASDTLVFTVGTLDEHQYAEIIDDAYLCHQATCYSKASYYKVCTVCHGLSKETFEVGEIISHNYQQIVSAEFVYQPATCTSAAKYFESCIYCKNTNTNVFDAGECIDHTYIENIADFNLASAANCTTAFNYYKYCIFCKVLSSETFTVGKALGHDIIYVEEKIATPEEDGWSYYEYCPNCDYSTKVETKYQTHQYVEIINQLDAKDGVGYRVEKCTTCSDFKIYDADNNNISDSLLKYTKLDGYKSFDYKSGGEDFQNNYLAVLGKLLAVQFCSKNFNKDDEIRTDLVTSFNSTEESESCFACVKSDWPIIFFTTDKILASNNYIISYIDSKFLNGKTRNLAWARCASGIEELVKTVSNDTLYPNDLAKVKYVYDEIMNNIDYAYIKGTKEPEDNATVHSIYGYFSRYNCVCDGYSKTLQVILNTLGIHTYFVKGNADGGSHAWNYVTIDGRIYFCDITWDDLSNSDHKYFLLGTESTTEMYNRSTNASYFTSGLDYNPPLPTITTKDLNYFILYDSENNLIGNYNNIATVWQNVTDKTKDYILYLYDEKAGQVRDNLTIDLGLIPDTCHSMTIVGYYKNGADKSDTNLTITTSTPLQTNVILKDVYFVRNKLTFTVPSLYPTISIGEYDLTFTECSGYMAFNIDGKGSVYINDSLSSDTSSLCHNMNGTIKCNNLTINNCDFLLMNNIHVNNLYLSGRMFFVQGWSCFNIDDICISNLHVMTKNAFIKLDSSESDNPIELNITNIYGYTIQIDTKFKKECHIPYITINGTIENYVYICIAGKINDKYLNNDTGYSSSLCCVSSFVWKNLTIYTYNSKNVLTASNDQLYYDEKSGLVTFNYK